jgi:hypothetical protein
MPTGGFAFGAPDPDLRPAAVTNGAVIADEITGSMQ